MSYHVWASLEDVTFDERILEAALSLMGTGGSCYTKDDVKFEHVVNNNDNQVYHLIYDGNILPLEEFADHIGKYINQGYFLIEGEDCGIDSPPWRIYFTGKGSEELTPIVTWPEHDINIHETPMYAIIQQDYI